MVPSSNILIFPVIHLLPILHPLIIVYSSTTGSQQALCQILSRYSQGAFCCTTESSLASCSFVLGWLKGVRSLVFIEFLSCELGRSAARSRCKLSVLYGLLDLGLFLCCCCFCFINSQSTKTKTIKSLPLILNILKLLWS